MFLPRCFAVYIIFTVLVTVLPLTAGAAGHKHIVAVGDRAYPPLEYLDENGEPAGYNVEIFRAVAEQAGFTYEIRLMDWRHALEAVKNGEADVFIDLGYSSERSEDYIFGQAHNYLGASIVT